MITLSSADWQQLERSAEAVSAQLRTIVYWPPPDAMGSLGPDLLLAVLPSGERQLVIGRPEGDSFEISPYEPSR
jgi:hypothetical protein